MLTSIKESSHGKALLLIVTSMGCVTSAIFLFVNTYNALSDGSSIIFIPIFGILCIVYLVLLKYVIEVFD